MKVVDPGGKIEMKPLRSALKRVGFERCGTCHEIQLASWKVGGHARREPPLECEGCHGPGSEYKKSAVMKDEALSKKAGLLKPDLLFCARCHPDAWDEEMLKKVHEHGKVTAEEEEE